MVPLRNHTTRHTHLQETIFDVPHAQKRSVLVDTIALHAPARERPATCSGNKWQIRPSPSRDNVI